MERKIFNFPLHKRLPPLKRTVVFVKTIGKVKCVYGWRERFPKSLRFRKSGSASLPKTCRFEIYYTHE